MSSLDHLSPLAGSATVIDSPLQGSGRVRVGSNVCISQRAFLCTGSHDFRKETFDLITKPIVIGDGCWIAAGAFIGPGAEVPTGTMVKAGEAWKR